MENYPPLNKGANHLHSNTTHHLWDKGVSIT